uniref:Pilus formation protein N-terminal domain-containing protein n=1 Tax=Bosea sp. NBC_00436 TaxID=2969620 RepID=A0A9E8CP57_9HYPH
MKMLLVLAMFALGLSGPALAMSGVDQDGNRVEIDDGQPISPGRDIVVRMGGEQKILTVEGVTRNGRAITIDVSDEDDTPYTFTIQEAGRPNDGEPNDDEM